MTIRDYLLGKPDGCTFEIIYIFEGCCAKCGKSIQNIDEEYSNLQTVGEFRQHVNMGDTLSHYYGYDFIYNDFDIEDSDIEVEENAEKVSITITKQDAAGYEVCEECTAAADAELRED